MEASIDLDVFEGRDFHSWRKRTIAKLRAMGLWRIVTDEEHPPKDEEKLEAYLNRRDRAYGLIELSLSAACQDCLRSVEGDPERHGKSSTKILTMIVLILKLLS